MRDEVERMVAEQKAAHAPHRAETLARAEEDAANIRQGKTRKLKLAEQKNEVPEVPKENEIVEEPLGLILQRE